MLVGWSVWAPVVQPLDPDPRQPTGQRQSRGPPATAVLRSAPACRAPRPGEVQRGLGPSYRQARPLPGAAPVPGYVKAMSPVMQDVIIEGSWVKGTQEFSVLFLQLLWSLKLFQHKRDYLKNYPPSRPTQMSLLRRRLSIMWPGPAWPGTQLPVTCCAVLCCAGTHLEPQGGPHAQGQEPLFPPAAPPSTPAPALCTAGA